MNKIKSFLQKETSKNVGYIGLSKGFSILLGFSTIALSARGLGVKQFGVLALFISFTELGNIIGLPGFNPILNKALHRKDYSFYREAYRYSILASITLGIFVAGALFLLYHFGGILDFKTFKLAIFALIFSGVRNLDKSDAVLTAVHRFKQLSVISFLSSLSRFIGVGITGYLSKDIFIVIISYTLCQSVVSFISLYNVRKILVQFPKTFNIQNYLKESIKMNVVEFFNIGVAQIDKLILYTLSPTTLGIFQAGFSYPDKIKDVLLTLMSVIQNSWLTYGNNEFIKRTKQNALMAMTFMIAGFIALYVATPYYIPILLGVEYIDAIPFARLATFIILLRVINSFFASRDIVYGEISRYQKKIVLFKIVYLILLFLLIERYNIYGIMIAMIVADIVCLFTLLYDFKVYPEPQGNAL